MYSINPLYLITNSAAGYFKEKDDEKYPILHYYEEFLSGIRSDIKTLNGGKELFYEKTALGLELSQMMICL